ncbi:NAD-dependent epimerase/dehydratase family protein [Aquipuribacter nitratireducens]|uniref:NAD-dependent epimerase/dehydratase family protein n=1 Tax=Aquipuribacter nitratireducens TaxID=650104 RepID=A0ABW0GSM5_9MICO
MAGRTVLVTGVSRYLGGKVAAALARHPARPRVVGLDVVPPPVPLGEAAFVRADIRSPAVGRLLREERVDTVVHMNVIATPRSAGGRVPMKEINVLGTMQLLAACQKAPGVRRLVVKSTSGVYGAGPADPAMFTESTAASSPPRTGWAKDCLEVEGYVRGFTRRRPDVQVALLRFASIVGPGLETPLSKVFALPAVPTLLGHDGRLQVVHEDDAVEAMVRATIGPPGEHVTGAVNVAGDGVLTTVQAAALAGRPVVGVPERFAGAAARWLTRAGAAELTVEDLRLLGYGRVLDTTRCRTELGFVPARTTRQAFEDFCASHRLRGVRPAVDLVAEELRSAVVDTVASLERASR